MSKTRPGAPAATRPAPRDVAEPVQQFFSIGDVCTLTDLKPHVLRYWESQFKFLSPAKNRSGNRVYQRREVELILLVKHLLYTEKYTIDGARRRVDEHRKAGELRGVARAALDRQTLELMEAELAEIVELLGGPPDDQPS
jgi:DNA-binding transcriptional MerR regulator